MRKTLSVVVFVALISVTPTLAQVSVGDVVNLKERHLHIPAHPAPGDSQVHFRFTSESQATILDIDSAASSRCGRVRPPRVLAQLRLHRDAEHWVRVQERSDCC